jgi:V/A-type H+-transporting ATPase subunit B
MNTMIRFYSGARDAEQKQAMAFELSDFDHKLIKFGRLFRERFMDIESQAFRISTPAAGTVKPS